MSRSASTTRRFQYRPPVQPAPGQGAAGSVRDDRYTLLFRIDFRHRFFNNVQDHCPGFTVTPSPDSVALMSQLNLLFRAGEAGFAVYYNRADAQGLTAYLRAQSATPASPGDGQPGCWTRLTFTLQSGNADFVNITDLPITTNPNQQNLYACNSQAHADGPVIRFCRGDYLSQQDLYPVTGTEMTVPVSPGQVVTVTDLSGAVVKKEPAPPPSAQAVQITIDFSGLPLGIYTVTTADGDGTEVSASTVVYTVGDPAPLCLLDVLLTQPNPSMTGIYPVPPLWEDQGGGDDDAMGNVTYVLPFQARSTQWRYYLSPLGPGGTFSGLRIEGSGADFTQAPQPVLLPNGIPAVLFTSLSALPLRQYPTQRFRLTGQRSDPDGSEQDIKIDPLPAAAASPVWPAAAGGDGGVSEIFIYA